MSSRTVYASFSDEHSLLDAIAIARARGLEVVDAWTPHPVHGIETALGLRRTRLPYVTFAAGTAGAAFALWFQYWASWRDWPIDVGGKPFDSLPAFLPVTFEMLVLGGGLATAFFFLARSRLWPGRRSCQPPRTSDDRYVLAVAPRGAVPAPEEVERELRAAGAVETWQEVRG